MKKHYILGKLRGKDTDAALILQLNAELLGTGVGLPKWKQSYVENVQRDTEYKKNFNTFALA